MRPTEAAARTSVGFLGLGQMGGSMARHLLEAGHAVSGYDPRPGARAQLKEAGGTAVADEAATVAAGAIVFVCLPTSQAFVQLAEQRLLPLARPGQVVVDHGTTSVPATRRLAAAFAARGAALVDAPVSGGEAGAARGRLRLWVGGEQPPVQKVWPLLRCYAAEGALTRLGGPGCGQAGKAVHQLKSGLGSAALLEAIAFGLRSGLDPAVLRASFGGSDQQLDRLLEQIQAGDPCPAESKIYEFAYYLEQAQAAGFRLPMMEALLELCRDQPRSHRDPVNRPVPSIWQALLKAERDEGEAAQ